MFSSLWSERWGSGTHTSPNDPHDLYPRWAIRHARPIEFTGTPPIDVWIGHAHGWPLLSMCSYRNGANAPPTIHWGKAVRADVESFNMPVGVLPFKPIWPGFAINTVFYAAILWLLFAALFTLRRRRRIKRGLCPACAYPVGVSDICTECGGSVQHASGNRAALPSPPS